MGSAGLNLKDARGHTVLHVAARRNEPEVMVTLLSKGACASETTSDGQTAVAICRRMTRRKDYVEATKQGQGTNKDRLCIDVLEREMRRNSMSENLAMPTEVMDDHFQAELDYLENRVAFVLYFPSEARVAMEIAGADTATGLSALGQKGRQLRLLTLLKTVETGQRYFPHCSEVVNDFLNWTDASTQEMDEEKLKVDMGEAFCKDVAYHRRLGLPSSWPAFYQYMAGSNQSAFYKYVAESNGVGMSTSSAASN
ncbi:hypothetical protein AB3S75_037638 [Citrus x aurantiifolia]